MAEVTLELLGAQIERLFGELRELREEVVTLKVETRTARTQMVTKGDLVALFRGLELKIEAWCVT